MSLGYVTTVMQGARNIFPWHDKQLVKKKQAVKHFFHQNGIIVAISVNGV